MTKFIAHRINSSYELVNIDANFGVELDIRDNINGLYLSHDPFSTGQEFESFLKNYHHGLIILNIKSERIEYRVLDALKKYHLEEYFFLDSSFPMLKKLSDEGERNLAIRFSELESLDTVIKMAGRASWVWVDCFSSFPLDRQTYDLFKSLGYKICIVSPELQGQDEKIEIYGKYMLEKNIFPDAVCSKAYNFNRWCSFFSFC